MAQFRYFDYKAIDSTFNLNALKLAAIPAGLYRGFDVVDLSIFSSMLLTMTHDVTGFQFTNLDGTNHPNIGAVHSCQGVWVCEDAPIDITLADNPTGLGRWDLIYMTHTYIAITGGQSAIYDKVQGSTTRPSVPNPLTDVAIAYVYLPPLTSALNAPGVIYERVLQPSFGNNPDYVRVLGDQDVLGIKGFLGIRAVEIVTGIYNGGVLQLPANSQGNSFMVLPNSGGPSFSDVWSFDVELADNQIMFIWSRMRLKFNAIGSGGQFVSYTGTDLYCAEEELVMVTKAPASLQMAGPVPQYLVTQLTSHAINNVPMKTKAAVVGNKSANLAPISSFDLFLEPHDGDFFDVVISGQTIRYINTWETFPVGGPFNNGGGKVTLRLTGTSLTVNNATGAPAAGYRYILTPTGTTMTFSGNTILELIEDTSGWRIVNIIDAQRNAYSLYAFQAGLTLNNIAGTVISIPSLDDILRYSGTPLAWRNENGTSYVNDKIRNITHLHARLRGYTTQFGVINVSNELEVTENAEMVVLSSGVPMVITDIVPSGGAFSFPLHCKLSIYVAGSTLTINNSAFFAGYASTTGIEQVFEPGDIIDVQLMPTGQWYVVGSYPAILRNKADVQQPPWIAVTFMANWGGVAFWRRDTQDKVSIRIDDIHRTGGGSIGPFGVSSPVFRISSPYPSATTNAIILNSNDGAVHRCVLDSAGFFQVVPLAAVINVSDILMMATNDFPMN